jgi:hypothetical protein
MHRTERYRLSVLGALYAAPIVAMLWWASSGHPPRSIIAITLTAAIVGCLIAGITHSWRMFFLIQFPLALLGLAYAVYTVTFGMTPGRTLAGLLVGTSWDPRIASTKMLPVGVVASAEMLPATAPATMLPSVIWRHDGNQDDARGAGRTDQRGP